MGKAQWQNGWALQSDQTWTTLTAPAGDEEHRLIWSDLVRPRKRTASYCSDRSEWSDQWKRMQPI